MNRDFIKEDRYSIFPFECETSLPSVLSCSWINSSFILKFVDAVLRGLKVLSINKIRFLASSAYQSCHLLSVTPPHPAPPTPATPPPCPSLHSVFKNILLSFSISSPHFNLTPKHSHLQTLNSVTPHLDVEECSIALLPRNREKNRSMDVLPPDRALAFLVTTEGESNNYVNAALADSFHRQAAFIVTPHPLPGTTADFWRLVFDYGCTAVVMLNQLNQSNSAWVRSKCYIFFFY